MWSTARLLATIAIIMQMNCILANELFPFGSHEGDQIVNRQEEEGASPPVYTTVSVIFYGHTYESLYVNTNGLLSFLVAAPNFLNYPFPLEYPIIAPLSSDVDTRGTGTVYYRETQSPDLLNRANALIQSHFPTTFEASSLFIATWDRVGYFEEGTDRVNTFQVVLATDGDDTFAFFLYADNGIQWIQGTGKNSNLPDARAQAGFVSEDERFYELRGSGTDQVHNLARDSNIDQTGIWLFRIGKLSPDENIQVPSVSDIGPEITGSCSSGGLSVCHNRAACVDFAEGFCCECIPGFYGNGHICLQEGIPQRLSGKANGTINGKTFIDQGLFVYFVVNDGRAYTAISRIPPSIGYSAQALVVIGSASGWLFAKPTVKGIPNGFQMTGGVFNHTTVMSFSDGTSAVIEQYFLGLDVHDQLRIEANIHGNVPDVPSETKFDMDDYDEIFTHSGPGVLRSQSTHTYKVNNILQSFTVDQQIEYSPCSYSPLQLETLRFRFTKNLIIYDAKEEIARFATTAKVSSLDSGDPCEEGRQKCGPNSACVVDGDDYRCVCNHGYEHLYGTPESSLQDAVCVDVNECDGGTDNCHVDATCLNHPGGFTCVCKEGFEGDGTNCYGINPCASVQCPRNAECVVSAFGTPDCRCFHGFEQGPGPACYPVSGPVHSGEEPPVSVPITSSTDCRVINTCDPFAECLYSPEENSFACKCIPGYTGNGILCARESAGETCDIVGGCSHNGACIHDAQNNEYVCVCLPGFEGDGYTCTAAGHGHGINEGIPPEPSCVLDVCWCAFGYQYDGVRCVPSGTDDIDKTDVDGEIAHPLPSCELNPPYECICPIGYAYNEEKGQCVTTPTFIIVTNGTKGPSGASGPPSCDVLNNCHPYARCVYDFVVDQHRCQCISGFEGDGYICHEIEISCDQSTSVCHANATCVYDDYNQKSVCLCNVGFRGDGAICAPDDECSSFHDCHPDHAQCSFDSHTSRYRCVCDEGYVGDGKTCSPADEDFGSNILSENECSFCHRDAQCVYDPHSFSYVCQCNPGFAGDGKDCQPSVIGCNILNDCHPNADCLYDSDAQGYRCRCEPNYSGDGHYCQPVSVSCHQDRSVCDPNAACVLTNDNQFICVCRHNYVGNGRVCEEIPKFDSKFLLVNLGIVIVRLPLPGSSEADKGRPIHVQPFQTAVGIDINCIRGRVYWSDVMGKAILSSNYDGSNRTVFMTKNIDSPEGLSIDWISSNIYWTDSLKDTIEVASLESNARKVLVSDGLVNPRGIAVHPSRGRLFWTDWNRDNPVIETANADGSSRRVLVKRELGLPNSLLIDFNHDELCWADAGTKRIECIGIDGQNRRVVVASAKYPFGLTSFGDYFYWTDWETKNVESGTKVGGIAGKSIPLPLAGSGKLYGLVAIPEQCPQISSPCQHHAACPEGHLRLPNGHGGCSCLCPDEGETSTADGIECNDLF